MIRTPISLPAATVLTPCATVLSASMSRPESVSSRIAIVGRWSGSWRISMRFFSPPRKPSWGERLARSRGTFVSSIAASTVLRKSLSEISFSPCASRWAFMTIRRYFVTVTPGIATGYWNAMNRPARARSSGSASVMSSPRKRIWPSVTSSVGWPMITLASVDLPEPFGPMRAWISPLLTVRSRPLRIFLSPAWTCRLRISRSAMCSGPEVGVGFWCSWSGVDGLARRGDLALLEGDELGERGLGERLDDAALHPRPQELRGAAVAVVGEGGAQDAPLLGVVHEARHRRDGALEGEDR